MRRRACRIFRGASVASTFSAMGLFWASADAVSRSAYPATAKRAWSFQQVVLIFVLEKRTALGSLYAKGVYMTRFKSNWRSGPNTLQLEVSTVPGPGRVSTQPPEILSLSTRGTSGERDGEGIQGPSSPRPSPPVGRRRRTSAPARRWWYPDALPGPLRFD